jgi:hypothetical protein
MVETRLIYDRIRELCSKAAAADDSEVQSIMSELHTVIREQAEFIELMIGNAPNRIGRPQID